MSKTNPGVGKVEAKTDFPEPYEPRIRIHLGISGETSFAEGIISFPFPFLVEVCRLHEEVQLFLYLRV